MRTLLLAAVLCSTACTTTMVSTWKKPGQGPINFQKIAVIAAVKEDGMRRQIEDQIVNELGAGRAVPSYTMQPTLPIDKEAMKAQLAAAGYDGAVAVRIAGVEKDVDYYGSYSYGWGTWPYYEPGYVNVDTYVRVETNIYELPQADLIFAATSRTMNPSSAKDLVNQTVKAVREELKKEGLIQKPVAAR